MFKQYRQLERFEVICVGGDCSMGCGDRSVAQFYSKTKFDYPIVYSTKESAITMTNDIHPVLEKICEITGVKPLVAYERNNGGVFEMERLATLNRLGKYAIYQMQGIDLNGTTKKLGWDTNSATRPEMLSILKESIDSQIDKIYDEDTIKELFSFVVVQSSNSYKAQAEKNSHDDFVMAAAVAKMVSLKAELGWLKTGYEVPKSPLENTKGSSYFKRRY